MKSLFLSEVPLYTRVADVMVRFIKVLPLRL